MGNTINEMIFNNNYVVPCMQRIVCSIVSVAANAENPTSTDKIIDGLSRYYRKKMKRLIKYNNRM